jgi:hypothetical protein
MIFIFTSRVIFKKLLLISCFTFIITKVFSQESLSKKINFDISAKVWMQQNFENNSKISMPNFIKERRNNTTLLPISFDKITDNPLIHGASYVDIATTTTYKQKVKIYFDLFTEHRGVSYGIFDKNSIIVLPIFSIKANDTFKLLKKAIFFEGSAGMYLNEKLDEGLTIYNIDAQGYKFKLENKKWGYQYTVYGDFINGIGLNIDDLHSFSIWRKLNNKDSTNIGVSLNHKTRTPFSTSDNKTFNLFGNTNIGKAKLSFQLGYRPSNNLYNFFRISNNITQKLAAFIGLEKDFYINGISIKNKLEFRYYGSIFNERNYNYGLLYRNPATNDFEMYANTIGKFIYPLRKFDTPFSQWAVYNEYTNSSVLSLNLRGSLDKDLNKNINFNILYDINFIHSNNNDAFTFPLEIKKSSFIYPFFTASINYKIVDEVSTGFILTNKSMNLDLPYPTHYLLSKPSFGIRLVANIK